MSHDDTHNNGNHLPVTETSTQIPGDLVDANAIAEAQAAITMEGLQLGKYISARTFISAEELTERLLRQPKGTSIGLGTVAGYVTGYDKRESKLPSGETTVSMWLRGTFEAIVYATGEVHSASWWIVPKVMGEAIEDALRAGDRAVLDIEFGAEASGRTVPAYYYTVRTFVANAAQAAVSTIRMRQQKRMQAKGIAALKASATPQLSAPSTASENGNHKRKAK